MTTKAFKVSQKLKFQTNKRLFQVRNSFSKGTLAIVLLSTIALLIASCNGDSKLSPAAQRTKRINKLAKFSALPQTVKHPSDNPFSEEKAALGKLLFFDPILSGNKDVACATCHHPSHGYAEFVPISIGVNGEGLGSDRRFKQPNSIPFTKRNAQTVLNTAFNGIDHRNKYNPKQAPMFWDLRAESLEEQALIPIKSLEEMRGESYPEEDILGEVVARLQQIPEYRTLFSEAFEMEESINQENLAKAIATFERTLVTTNSRFDRYMRGEEDAMSISEKEGFELFKKVGCGNCHNGPMFSDFKPHILGVHNIKKLPFEDKGIDSSFAFRTPSLRNLRFTGPYFHNGTKPGLHPVLLFYEDISGGKNINPHLQPEQLDPLIDDIDIKVKDMNAIVSFLNTLNDDSFDKEVPHAVPSGLPVGGNIHELEF